MSSLSVKRLIIDSPGCSLPNLVYFLLSLFVTRSEAYTNIGVAPESACAKNTSARTAVRFRRAPINYRARRTFRRVVSLMRFCSLTLPAATRADFALATAAMRARFEPESKKELYMAEMQTRTKKRKEDWAAFGEELKLLADKAYPDLQEEARERLALNQYLARRSPHLM